MPKTFVCPHCANAYPILPTLVGRKVRCTHCKQAFQLQYDGIAIKIGVTVQEKAFEEKKTGRAVDAQAEAALERKSSAGAPVPSQISESGATKPNAHVGVGRAVQSQGPRPQTRAIKRHTERIQKIRSSLQDAAELAVESVQRISGQLDISQAQSHVDPVKPREFSPVVHTGVDRKQRKVNRVIIATFLGIMLFACLIPLLFDRSAERRALRQFTADISAFDAEYPRREAVYRGRMWLYSRDGKNMPPLVVNAHKALIQETLSIDWPEVLAACSPELDGLVLNRRFAIWHKLEQTEFIEKGWVAYQNKANIEDFYQQLTTHAVPYFRADQLQQLLLKRGVSREAVYVMSALLAGTTSPAGAACPDFGFRSDNIPSQLQVAEFDGEDGHVLLDAGGYYGGSSCKFYCGLVVGFTRFGDVAEHPEQWRILDIRLASSMQEFYTAQHNPLQLLASAAYADLRAELVPSVVNEPSRAD